MSNRFFPISAMFDVFKNSCNLLHQYFYLFMSISFIGGTNLTKTLYLLPNWRGDNEISLHISLERCQTVPNGMQECFAVKYEHNSTEWYDYKTS